MIAALIRWASGLLAALTLALAGPTWAQDGVRDTSYTAPDGGRVLQHQVEIDATPAQAWAAFTTSEGLKSWAVPVAQADFRVGGIWESTYDVKGRIGAPGNIQNR